MTKVDAATAADELDRSIELIETHLGQPCRHFAYPKAMPPSEEADAEVRRRFRTAALAGNRVNVPGRTDPARLGRTPLLRRDDERVSVRKVRGGARVGGLGASALRQGASPQRDDLSRTSPCSRDQRRERGGHPFGALVAQSPAREAHAVLEEPLRHRPSIARHEGLARELWLHVHRLPHRAALDISSGEGADHIARDTRQLPRRRRCTSTS